MTIALWSLVILIGAAFIGMVIAVAIEWARESREADSADCGACEGEGLRWWAE